MIHIWYFHGFNSASTTKHGLLASTKVEVIEGFCRKEGFQFHPCNLTYHDPTDLQHELFEIRSKVRELESDTHVFVGTSLGGLIAFSLANALKTFDVRAVAINPAIIQSSLEEKVGQEFTNYVTSDRYILTKGALEAHNSLRKCFDEYLLSIDNPPVTVILEEGDEVLDSGKTAAAFKYHARVVVFPGGNHQFSRIEEVLPEIGYTAYAAYER